MAGQRRAHLSKGTTKTKTGASKVEKHRQSKQVQLEQRQNDEHKGRSNGVVQNKENKVSSKQRPPHNAESSLHCQSRRLAPMSGEPEGRSWHNASVNNQPCRVKLVTSQMERFVETQGGATDLWHQMAGPSVSQYNYRSRKYNGATNTVFTSDQLPDNGAIIFDRSQAATTGQESVRRSAQPAPANSAAPIREVDVTAMLKQIRRALGVREPCRADREARRQKSEAGVQVADPVTSQQSRTEAEQPAGTSALTEKAQDHEKSSGGADRLPNNGNNASQVATNGLTSPKRCTEKTASSEPDSNKPKVRIAHKAGQAHGEKEAGCKSTTNTLLSFSGARSNQNWTAGHEEVKRKAKGMQR